MHTETEQIYDWTVTHADSFSGDVELESPGGQVIKIPFCVLFKLVAGYVRDRKLAALEQASDGEVMGMPDD